MRMKIGELAKMAGCPVVTIRFYEKEGLLTEPERTGANYRVYGDKEIDRLRFIKHCRRHGMTLAEIRELLAFKDNPRTDCSWVGTLVGNHIANVEEQIQSLTQLKAQLEELIHKCSGGAPGECGIIESLGGGDGCPYCEGFRCRVEQHAKQKNLKQITVSDKSLPL